MSRGAMRLILKVNVQVGAEYPQINVKRLAIKLLWLTVSR